jgi:hypothetical protein
MLIFWVVMIGSIILFDFQARRAFFGQSRETFVIALLYTIPVFWLFKTGHDLLFLTTFIVFYINFWMLFLATVGRKRYSYSKEEYRFN